jgi:hypothetical protein
MVLGRARLQPGHYDPDENEALAPEGIAYVTRETTAAEIKSQWKARRRRRLASSPPHGCVQSRKIPAQAELGRAGPPSRKAPFYFDWFVHFV